MTPLRLLLVSGGSLVGQNIVDTLRGRRQALFLSATNSSPHDLALAEYDRVYLTPPTVAEPAAFATRLQAILAQEDPDLVIPCRDDDTVFLARLQEQEARWRGRFLCGSSAVAEAMCDKFRSWEFSQAWQLPFVPTLATPASPEVVHAFAASHGFPLLVKPRRGFAGRGVFLVFDAEQLARAAALADHVIQRFLGDAEALQTWREQVATTGLPLFYSFEGIKHSLQLHIGPQGEPLGAFWSRNVNRNGTSLRLERAEGPALDALAARCLQAFAQAGWRGPVNVQCQQTPGGELWIYEYNARISGATAARQHMGCDEMALVLQGFLQHALPAADVPARQQVIRRQIDITADPAVASALLQQGVWDAPL